MICIRSRFFQYGIASVLTLFISHSSARAAVIDVPCNTPALVAALQTAETNGQSDTINLATKCLYQFVTFNASDVNGNNALPILDSQVEIVGNQATLKRDPSAGSFRILKVGSSGVVTLRNLTITGGQTANATASTTANKGGGILNKGSLTIDRSTIESNQTGNGQLNASSPYYFGGDGGGISSSGSLTIRDSTVAYNRTGNAGQNINGLAGSGAGINTGQGATTLIERSTIHSNQVGGFPVQTETPAGLGGGLFVGINATLIVKNSSLFANTAGGNGGAIYNTGITTINHATIASNDSTGILTISNTLNLNNSIISGHPGPDCFLSSGGVNANNNLLEDTGTNACTLINGTNANITGGNADLQFPGDNGGPTATMRLGPASQAINKGSTAPEAFDQRGIRRPQPTGMVQLLADIGAIENEILATGVESGLNFEIYSSTMDQWFEVDLQSGDKVTFAAQFSHASGDLDVELYNKDNLQNPLQESSSTTDNESLAFTAQTAGKYWIRVFGFSGATNTYSFNILVKRNDSICIPIGKKGSISLICL